VLVELVAPGCDVDVVVVPAGVVVLVLVELLVDVLVG
jgi:hypothetical protein